MADRGTSSADSHPRGHLVYAAQGVLSVRTERGTSIVPANRVAWTPAGFTHYHRAHGQTDMRILFRPLRRPGWRLVIRPSSRSPTSPARRC